MKTIKINKFSDYSLKFLIDRWNIKHLFLNNIDFLYPKPLIILTLISLLLITLFNTKALTFFIPLLGLYFYNYFILKKIRSGLKIKRTFPKKSKEDKIEELNYQITNPYAFDCYNFIMSDNFTGMIDKDGETKFSYFFEILRKNRNKSIQRTLVCNNGMGIKNFGPLSIFLSDPLGIHLLSYEDETRSSAQIYPLVYATQSPKVHPMEDSIEFGLFDTIKRGQSVNFFRTREYVQGDSIKTINWKLSLKSQKLIVNEFENNSNANVEMILIDDQRVHVGLGKNSTFEYCKDLMLSLCQSHTKTNNKVSFHSHQKYIGLKNGLNHLNSLEMLAAGLEPKNFSSHNIYHKQRAQPLEVIDFQKRMKLHLSADSDSFIFTGITPGKVWSFYLELFKTVALKSKSTHLIVVNGIDHLSHSANQDDQVWLSHIQGMLPKEIDELKIFCKKHQIKLYMVNIDPKIDYQSKVKNVFQRPEF